MGEKYAADGAEVRIHALQVEIVAWLVVFFAGNKRKGIFYTETKIMIYLVLFFFSISFNDWENFLEFTGVNYMK